MKSIADINAIRDKMRKELGSRESTDNTDTRIVVGMATCGIAAGARPVMNTFVKEVSKRNIKGVKVTQAGCLGMCKLEPMVQVYVPGQDVVTYTFVDSDVAKKIVNDHIVNGNVVIENVIGKEE